MIISLSIGKSDIELLADIKDGYDNHKFDEIFGLALRVKDSYIRRRQKITISFKQGI